MPPRDSLNSTFLTSLAALVVLVVTAAVTLPSLLIAAFGPGADSNDPMQRVAQLVERHDEHRETYEARFNGRSVFFKPPPPPPPPRDDPPPRRTPDPTPTPVVSAPREQPPPSEYRGPPVSSVMGDKVLFKGTSARDSGKWIRVGEERDGIKVLSVNPPRSVRVAYQRGEYDVAVFNWDMPYLASAALAGQPIPGLLIPPDPVGAPEPVPTGAQGRATPRTDPAEFRDEEELLRQHAEAQGIEYDTGEPYAVDPQDDPQDVPEDEPIDPEEDPEDDPEADPDPEQESDDESAENAAEPSEEVDPEAEPTDPGSEDDPEADDPQSDPNADPADDPEAEAESDDEPAATVNEDDPRPAAPAPADAPETPSK